VTQLKGYCDVAIPKFNKLRATPAEPLNPQMNSRRQSQGAMYSLCGMDRCGGGKRETEGKSEIISVSNQS